MNKSTAKYWQTTTLLTILFFTIVYIFFVSILSQKVASFHHSQPDIAYELPQQQLTDVGGYLRHILLIDNLARDNEQKLVIKVVKKNDNWLVTPLNFILFNIALAVFYPSLALLVIGFIAGFLILNYQKSKLKDICAITDGIAHTFGEKHSYKPEYSVLANLNYALEDIARYAKQYKTDTEQGAFCDALTKLTNRHTFLQHIEEQLTQSKEIKSGLLFIDLDGFKQVNDSFGHSFGDEVLIQVAERLNSLVRSNKLNFSQSINCIEKNLARLGGDEFTIFLFDIENSECAINIAKFVLSELEREFTLGNKTIKISASIGIAMYPESASKPNTLVQLADVAMYRAKKDGRGVYRIYSPEMGSQLRRYHYLLEEMRQALSNHSFFLTFQPIIHVEGCVISYFEALVRWQHPVEGVISPTEFIPIAEESNQILPLGDWILNEACRQMFAWYNAGMKKTKISVNVSVIQLKHRPIYQWVMDTLVKTGLPPSSLMLEITESCFLDISDEIITELEQLRQEGVFIAIDDFGTGFSSLAILATLPVDILKIDKMFINEATSSIKYKKILKSIIDMAYQLDLKVVAEGIENSIQLELLKSLGVKYIQGFLISHPENSTIVGNKVLNQGMNHLAHNGAGVWQPNQSKIIKPMN
ncbi:EAL domain-containing protein [Colwellia sp. MB02u-18]|uniref:putative bifunctional diguanylate cyclase/phosphodiesterase n=1 Tax=unclassified Colwellia TaxID=196834 RepID=UPI0015F56822|nr:MULTISPECIES: EAL domain-containing protein [unclassified Colwellia]MBA6224116.1 EAL domain-containing protein [Colwellia sp. MB3u-45]MBA6268992.1 EAL domain-containing protein [Colwellia sp. MB3u-43]MBA6320922.1 EAL domain-containing protein [Colwellia sp. MB02u-19]MBA6324202.1 EAL domain-containing protein [Colwellia sp. MB02u-18]MBA6332751.1 EAL domain-containing protein [Colwellia sp. MB02u-12]